MLVLVVVVLVLIGSLLVSQATVMRGNLRQSRDIRNLSQLRLCAETGLAIAFHEFQLGTDPDGGETPTPGLIGTGQWTPVTSDFGVDGIQGTGDVGEGDYLPTLGEPNINPVDVGPPNMNVRMFVYLVDTGVGNVWRVVSTAFDGELSFTTERYLQRQVVNLPRVGAVYVDPFVALDLKGNAFLVDGNDHNLDGSAGSADAEYGISAGLLENPGDAAALLLSQLDPAEYPQIQGKDGTPSVGEVETVDIDSIVSALLGPDAVEVAPGMHDDVDWGTLSSGGLQVRHCEGDLKFSGDGHGAGVLVVDGSLSISGSFVFEGVLIVRGDIRMVGGGSAIHLFGSLLVTDSISEIDPEDPEITITGQADIKYSDEALTLVETHLNTQVAANLTTLYYAEGHPMAAPPTSAPPPYGGEEG